MASWTRRAKLSPTRLRGFDFLVSHPRKRVGDSFALWVQDAILERDVNNGLHFVSPETGI